MTWKTDLMTAITYFDAISILWRTGSFENFSHQNRYHRTPHVGPTHHIFGERIRWKTHKNCNLESVLSKSDFFSPATHIPTVERENPFSTSYPAAYYALRRATHAPAPFALSPHDGRWSSLPPSPPAEAAVASWGDRAPLLHLCRGPPSPVTPPHPTSGRCGGGPTLPIEA
jgi:hypothetical protein